MTNLRGLVLAARVQMLTRNIETVYGALDTVEERRGSIRQRLPELAEGIRSATRAIEAQATKLTDLVPPAHEDDANVPADQIQQLARELRRVANSLDEIAKGVAEIPPDSLRAIREHLSKLGSTSEDAQALRDAVTSRSEGSWIPAAVAADWRSEHDLYERSKPFFIEYVKLLTGLAVQGAGFDGSASLIADAMIRARRTVVYTMTVPGHRWREDLTDAHFLSLGFPEWSPWALGLTAFDAARVELLNYPITDVLPADPSIDMETCFADILATYLMGPAYAWAAMIVLLDPSGTPAERTIGTLRVALMADALRRRDPKDRETIRTFHALADELEGAWASALEEAEATPLLDDAPLQPDHAPIELPSAEVRSSWLDACIHTEHWGLDIAQWNEVREAAQELAKPLPELRTIDMRIVLNAAWLLRIEEGYDRMGDSSPLDDLSTRTMTLLARLANMPVYAESTNRPKATMARGSTP